MTEKQNPKDHGLGKMFVAGAIGLTLAGFSALIYNLQQGNYAQPNKDVCVVGDHYMPGKADYNSESKENCSENYFNEIALCELEHESKYELSRCIHKSSEEWRDCLKRQR